METVAHNHLHTERTAELRAVWQNLREHHSGVAMRK